MPGGRYQRPKQTIVIENAGQAPLYKTRRIPVGPETPTTPVPASRLDVIATKPLPPPPDVPATAPGAMDPFTLLSDDDDAT